MKSSLLIIIPAYNERYTIGNLLDNVPKNIKKNVLVIDDGSEDGTANIVKEKGFDVITLKKNSGKLNACIEGVKRSNDFCVFIDGDGQLNPKEIPKFIKALKNADVVIGERKMDHIPIFRKFSNGLTRKLINFMTGNNFKDVLCGFRAVRKDAFNKMKFKGGDYSFEMEMITEASRHSMKIVSVPVSVSYKVGSRMPLHKSFDLLLLLLKFTKNFIKKLHLSN